MSETHVIGRSSNSSSYSDNNNVERNDESNPVMVPIKQMSDVSEHLFISSTPEDESYFEMKKESLTEKVARGEMEIEVNVGLEDFNVLEAKNLELDVADKETLRVIPMLVGDMKSDTSIIGNAATPEKIQIAAHYDEHPLIILIDDQNISVNSNVTCERNSAMEDIAPGSTIVTSIA